MPFGVSWNSAWRRESRGSASETSQDRIPANRELVAHDQLALRAAVVQDELSTHVVAPRLRSLFKSRMTSERRFARLSRTSMSVPRRNGTTPRAPAPRSSSTG